MVKENTESQEANSQLEETHKIRLQSRLELRNRIWDRLLLFVGAILLAWLVTSRIDKNRLDTQLDHLDHELYFHRVSEAIETIELKWWDMEWARMNIADSLASEKPLVNRLWRQFDSTFFAANRAYSQFSVYLDERVRTELNRQALLYDAWANSSIAQEQRLDSLFQFLASRRTDQYRLQIAPGDVRARIFPLTKLKGLDEFTSDSAFLEGNAGIIYTDAKLQAAR